MEESEPERRASSVRVGRDGHFENGRRSLPQRRPIVGVVWVDWSTAVVEKAGGMPLSVQLVGRPGAEDVLYSLAGQLEEARPWSHHRPPVT